MNFPRVDAGWLALSLIGPGAFASNQTLTTGIYGGTLGAGGATAAERMAYGQNPAALQPSRTGLTRVGFHLDFHRPFGLEDVEVSEAGVFGDFAQAGLGLAWRETGVDDLYREQGLSLNPVLRVGSSSANFPGHLDFGGTWTWWFTEVAGVSTSLDCTQGLGLVWRMLPRLKVGGFATGLEMPGSRSSPPEKIYQWGIEAASRDPDVGRSDHTSQILRLDFRKAGTHAWRSLAALTLSPHPALKISAGFASPPFQVSFGLNLAWEGLQWYQSLRYHRYLGRTFLSGCAYAHDIGNKGK